MIGPMTIADQLTVILPFRIPTAAVMLAAMASVLPAQALAEKVEVQKTREEVAAACEAAAGVGFGYLASSGSYGCVTDNAWIDCDDDGNCEGEVLTDDETPNKCESRFADGPK